MVGSLRLLARANPKTSRTGPPGPPTAAAGPALWNGCSEPTFALATWVAACCITDRCDVSGLGVGEVAAIALAGTKPQSATADSSTGTKCLIRCFDIGGLLGVRTLHARSCERQINAVKFGASIQSQSSDLPSSLLCPSPTNTHRQRRPAPLQKDVTPRSRQVPNLRRCCCRSTPPRRGRCPIPASTTKRKPPALNRTDARHHRHRGTSPRHWPCSRSASA